jgi:hypothetical protein
LGEDTVHTGRQERCVARMLFSRGDKPSIQPALLTYVT